MAKQVVVGRSSEIPIGEGRNVQVEGQLIAIFRTRSGGLFATQAHCPHRQGPLVDGLVGTDTLICPLHEWQFDLRSGETTNGTCGLQTYSVQEDEEGWLHVELSPEPFSD